jgi:hypothetical protein
MSLPGLQAGQLPQTAVEEPKVTSNSKHDRAGGGNSAPVVHVNGTDLEVVRYRDEPVVTFAIIDKVHGRVPGTARRALNENRERFVEGIDYVSLTSDEIRSMSLSGAFRERTARGTLLTRRGYLKLVKSLNDDVAWAVLEEMVDRYFVVETALAGAVDRDMRKLIVEAAHSVIRAELGPILEAMVRGEAASLKHKLVTEYLTVGEVLDLEKVPSKGRRGLINAAASSLRRFCEEHGVVPRRVQVGTYSAYVYSPDIAVAWLRARGRALIAEHLDRLRGQPQLFTMDGRVLKPAG